MALKFKISLAMVSRIIGMSVITVFAVLVMIAVNLKGRKVEQGPIVGENESKRAFVSIVELEKKPVEIVEKYSGIIRPFERYSLSFKSSGRVIELGTNGKGQVLDEGDTVRAGQVIAKLDTLLLEAQKAELEVSKEYAQSEFEIAEKLSQTQGAISDSQYKLKKSERDVAVAKLNTIQTQIDDGILKSKVSGLISKRLIKPGESVGLGQTVFELIQVNQVKLVVGVPESKIHRMIGPLGNRSPLDARVTLIGTQADGASKELEGEVHLVSEASDDKSGLFEVEIMLENGARRLRPGMIGVSDIIVDRFEGYEIPANAVFIRDEETYVFVFDDEPSAGQKNEQEDGGGAVSVSHSTIEPNELSTADDNKLGKARKHVFAEGTFEFQGDTLIVKDLPENSRRIIVGGHRRLVHGRRVEFADRIQ